jgi:hypothetical protein
MIGKEAQARLNLGERELPLSTGGSRARLGKIYPLVIAQCGESFHVGGVTEPTGRDDVADKVRVSPH